MEKRIKKQIEEAINKREGALYDLVLKYYAENEGTERGVIICEFFFNRRGYWRTQKILRYKGFYLEQTTFYRIKDEILIDIALRACYEGFICPYSDTTQRNE